MECAYKVIDADEANAKLFSLQEVLFSVVNLLTLCLMLLCFSTTASATDANGHLPFSPELSAVSSFGNKDALIKDIESLRKMNLVKDNFESKAEYEERKLKYFRQQDKGKGYRLTFAINNTDNSKTKLVYFDPETEQLLVEMPSVSRGLTWMNSLEGAKLNWIHHSFIELASSDRKSGTYKATNRLGASIDVVELSETRYGLAVLSQASSDYVKDLRQKFAFPLSKKDAKDVLAKGKVNLEVVFDPRYPSAEGSPFLIKSLDRHEPSFDRPIDSKIVKYALPVRLLKVQVLDKTGIEIFTANGEHINVNPISK
jgi:hypothetical protein